LSLLNKTVSVVANGWFNLRDVCSDYLEWMSRPFYVILVGWCQDKADYVYSCFRSPKRGDLLYSSRVTRQFDFVVSQIPDVEYFKYGVRGHVESSCLSVTLTFSRDLSIVDAWLSVGEDVNRFLSGLKRKYGKISHIRVWESHRDGYPHVHLLVFFSGYVFSGFSRVSKGKLSYRVQEKDAVASCWNHGFVDVKAMSGSRSGVRYLSKYLSKSVSSDGDINSKSVKTLACCWAFRRRAYGLSRSWGSLDLIMANSISNKSLSYYACLDNSKLFIGVQKWHVFGFSMSYVFTDRVFGFIDCSRLVCVDEDRRFYDVLPLSRVSLDDGLNRCLASSLFFDDVAKRD